MTRCMQTKINDGKITECHREQWHKGGCKLVPVIYSSDCRAGFHPCGDRPCDCSCHGGARPSTPTVA